MTRGLVSSYAQAGGNALAKNPLTRWPHGLKRKNVMDQMIILCDESWEGLPVPGTPLRRVAHNLLWPPATANMGAIQGCVNRLYNAQDSVIVYLTATPLLHGSSAVEDATPGCVRPTEPCGQTHAATGQRRRVQSYPNARRIRILVHGTPAIVVC